MCVLVVCTLQQFWCIYDLEKTTWLFLQNNENIEIERMTTMLLGHFHAMFNKVHTQYGTKMERLKLFLYK